MCIGQIYPILVPQLVGRGHRTGGKGGGLLGGRGQGGKGKGKGAIVSETCGHLGGQGENGESAAVQSGRALPKGRCASPPCQKRKPSKVYTHSQH